MSTFLSSPLLTMVLAMLTPTAAFCALNKAFFDNRQHALSLISVIVAGGTLGIIVQYLCHYIGSSTLQELFAGYGLNLANMIVCCLALLCFFLMSERFFSEVLPSSSLRHKVMATLTIILVMISALFSLLPLNSILLLYLLLSGLDARKPIATIDRDIVKKNIDMLGYQPQQQRNIKLKDKPNIYLFVLESYTSSDVLKNELNIDNSRFEQFLEKNQFTLYRNVFSNDSDTLSSVATLLTGILRCNPHGNALVLDILRENGYHCEFFDNSTYTFGRFPMKHEYASFRIPDFAIKLYSIIGPILSQSKYTRKIIHGIDIFDVDAPSNFYEECIDRIRNNTSNPKCVITRIGANHHNKCLPWGSGIEKTKELYKVNYQDSELKIETLIDTICKYDPNALIVAIGDHGLLLHHDFCKHDIDTATQLMASRHVSMDELARDLFSVQLAIRWATPYSINAQAISHVNVFRYILDSLSENKNMLLQDIAPNISLLQYRNYIAVRDGNPLVFLEEYDPLQETSPLLTRIGTGKGTIEDYCHLLEILPSENQKYNLLLNEAYDKFPFHSTILSKKAAWYASKGNKQALDLSHQAVKQTPQSTEIAITHLNILIDLGFAQEAISFAYKANLLNVIDLDIHKALITAYARLEQWEEAKAHVSNTMQNLRPISAVLGRCSLLNAEGKQRELIMFVESQYDKLGNYAENLTIRNFIGDYSLFSEMAVGNYESIINRLIPFVDSAPLDWAFRLLIYALEQSGKQKEALTLLDNLLQTRPQPELSLLTKELGLLAIRNNLYIRRFLPCIELANEQLQNESRYLFTCGRFDEKWYALACPDGIGKISPTQHYLLHGVYQGLNPTPWFNTIHYMINNPDLWRIGCSPFIHFLLHGEKEGRSPKCGLLTTMVDYPELTQCIRHTKVNESLQQAVG